MNICICGCGQEIPWKEHHKWRKPKYIPGHQLHHKERLEAHGRKVTIKPPPDFNPSGFCQCGCGQKTPIAKQTSLKRGQYRGFPISYIAGHNARGKRFKTRPGFKIDKAGYKLLYLPDHHLANNHGYVPEHRFVWEQVNGRKLNKNEKVHHIDGNKGNNTPENLVALTNSEHQKLHSAANGYTAKKEAQKKKVKNPEYRKKLSESGKKAWIKRKAKMEQENGN